MKIFVYGTLKKNGLLHDVIKHCKYLGKHVTKPLYRLESAGAFPVMASGNSHVKGEVYDVPEETMPILFHIEQAYQFKELENNIWFFFFPLPDDAKSTDVYNIKFENNTYEWLNKSSRRR